MKKNFLLSIAVIVTLFSLLYLKKKIVENIKESARQSQDPAAQYASPNP